MRIQRPKKVIAYVRLNEETVKQLDQIASHEETDRSTIIRRIVLKALSDSATKKSA